MVDERYAHFPVGDGQDTEVAFYQFRFSQYSHRFNPPLQTRYGIWEVRQGILLQFTDAAGSTTWGEIAPIPWLGSETLEQALEFCQQLPPRLPAAIAQSIPDRLPACQFGFESAVPAANTSSSRAFHAPAALSFSRLLPAGSRALEAWKPLWNQGCRTFKWKIGVYAIAEELNYFDQLIHQLPAPTRLRLDANGGLSVADAQRWLNACDQGRDLTTGATVEYLEQPLPPHQWQLMQTLSAHYQTAIALDESVATLQDLQTCYAQGWRGVVVIKPAIVGSPARLRQFCQNHAIDAVFSTAFETAIGRQAGLKLAAELANPQRAVGYDGDWHRFDYFESASLPCRPDGEKTRE